MSRLTYNHFARTGRQDCSNVIDAHEHREAWIALGRPTDPEAAINVVARAWGDDSEARAAWLSQCDADTFDDLDPEVCYISWRNAWQSCARGYVYDWIPEWDASWREVHA